MTARPASSILEVLHPDGFVSGVVALGSAVPASLEPGRPPATGPIGLAILAPTAAECSGDRLGATVAAVAERLADDGFVYALVPHRHRRRVRRLLASAGLRPELELVHLPDVSASRHLVPLERAPLEHLVGTLTSWRRWERSAGELVARLPPSVTRAVAPVGLVARRAGARPLFAWLRELAGAEGDVASVVVSRSWHTGHGGLVLACFAPGARTPWALAKLRDGTDGTTLTRTEAERLATLGPDAAAAGARLPRPLAAGRAGSREVLLEDAVPGRVAAIALDAQPASLEAVLERIAAWLAGWHARTATVAVVTREELDRDLLARAEALAHRVPGGDRYTAWLAELCAAVVGTPLPRVGVHHDLTMWNVLLDDDGGLGVVDWEGAEGSGLPLGDFLYAAVDAVAATRAYHDRQAAFEQCFSPGGAHRATVARLRDRLVRALGLTDEQATVCVHACWLRHAVDPRRTDHADREPFLRIVDGLIRSTVRPGAPVAG